MSASTTASGEILQLLYGMLHQSVTINFESTPLVEQRLRSRGVNRK